MNETSVPSGSALTHIRKPIAVSITLSCFIHLSHKCPVGLFHHIFQLLPSFRSRKGFLWRRANTGTGLLPGSSALTSQSTPPCSACDSQHGLLLFRSQRPFSFSFTVSLCILHWLCFMRAREQLQGLLKRCKFYYFKLYILSMIRIP